MTACKYWLMVFGWRLNAWLNASGLGRIPLFGGIWTRVKKLVARLLMARKGVPVSIKGEKFYIHPFSIGYAIGSYEPYTTELFYQVLQPGFTVLDIGAHHGYFSLIAARKVCREGRVYAFEPAPENFEILKKNIQLNQFTNVFLVNKAVGHKCTSSAFFLAEGDSYRHGLYPPPFHAVRAPIIVECVTIDEILAGKPIDVVKMDIEGNESYALEGMQETLSQNKRIVLFIEFNPASLRQAGISPTNFLAQLHRLGFEFRLINEEFMRLEPLTEEVLRRTKENVGWFGNLYCVKDGHS